MKQILLIFGLITALTTFSQIKIYKTFEDFQNKKGIDVDEIREITGGMNKGAIKTKTGKEKTTYYAKDIWGFTYKDVIFRSSISGNFKTFARVKIVGDYCFYENAQAHLYMLKNNTTFAIYYDGFRYYISKDLNSIVVPIDNASSTNNRFTNVVNRAYEKDPNLKQLCNCITNQKEGASGIEPCVKKLNVN